MNPQDKLLFKQHKDIHMPEFYFHVILELQVRFFQASHDPVYLEGCFG